MEGETLGDKAKVLRVVGGLKMNCKLWKLMKTQYLTSYADFKQQAGNLINNAELITQRLGEQESKNEIKKP